LDAKNLVLKVLNDISLIDSCKPYAHEVAEYMWLQLEKYLHEDLPSCLVVGPDILYAYFILGSVLRNTLYEALENNMPNCDDCSDRRIAHPYG
jgi:hypothetical protein